MSVKIIAQLNPFSNERKEFDFPAGEIQEIIKKIDSLGAVNTGWRIMRNDTAITDFSERAEDGDTLYIKIVPEGDNKQIGTAEKWTGVGLTVGGLALAIFTSGIGAGIGAAMIGAGIGLFAGGVCMYNMDIPNADREKPESDPSIRGSRSQMRPMGYIPVLFGRRRIYADIASYAYTWVDANGDQFLYQLFSVGQKDMEIDTSSIKIGETNITDFSATKDINKILSGQDGNIHLQISYGEDNPPLVTSCVHEDQLNSLLKHESDGADGSIIRTTPADTQEINVDIFFYSGLGKYNKDGGVDSTSVTVSAWYKDSSASDESYQLLGYFNNGSNVISGNELKTKRYSVHKTGLAAGSYTVKVVRETADSEDSKTIDQVYVGSIRSIKNEAPISAVRCAELTLIGLVTKQTDKLNGVIETLNFISQSILPVYSGSESGSAAWQKSLSSNPASAAMYAMQGELTQQRLLDSEIDWPAFEKFYNWCSLHKYECNAYITEGMTIQSLLSAIASTSRAEILRQNGKITVIQDIARDSYVQLFTPRNSWDYKEQIGFAEIPDALNLQFDDESTGFAKNELSVYNTPSGNKQTEPVLVQDVSLWGVTSSVQARKLGMYKYAVSKNRPLVHSFSADFEYLMCQKGDLIAYAGDIALAGVSQGRITKVQVSDGAVSGFSSDEVLEMEAGRQYAVRIRKNDGSCVLLQLANSAGSHNEVSFAVPQALDIGINEGDLFAFGTQGNDSIELIVTDIQPGENLSAELTCVEYAPEIFGVDNPDFVLPDFVNKITPQEKETDPGNVDRNFLIEKQLENVKATVTNLYSNHIVTLYKSSTLPLDRNDLPSGICTYNFSNNGISWTGESDGWTLAKPVTNDPVYVTSATAYGKSATDDILPNEWATPIPMGLNGSDGINTCTINLYKRLSETPAIFPETLTYNFSTGTLIGNKNGWEESIPDVDENDNAPCWEIHATAMSTTSTDTIEASEWSSPAKITQDGYSKEEIQSWISEVQTESPNVYVTPSTGIFAVDDEGIIQREQSVNIEVKVIQTNEELDFTFGAITVPSGFTVTASNHVLILTAHEGTKVRNCYFDIPIVFTKFIDNYNYVDPDNNPYVHLNCQDGQWFGEINSLANLPQQANMNWFLWTAVDTQSTEETVEGGVFKQNTYYYSNGIRFKEAIYVPYGMGIMSQTQDTFTSTFGITTVYGGSYLEGIDSVANIPVDAIIGDYFTWTGADQTACSAVQGGKLLAGCCYKWEGVEWVKDTSAKHRATAMQDLMKVAEDKLAQNNSDVIEYVRDLIAMNVVTRNIQVTGEALIDSAITAKLTLGKQGDQTGYFRSWNYNNTNQTGFSLGTDGKFVANEATIRGAITATSLTLASGVSVPANKVNGLADVATSGSYSDLSEKPTIPDVSKLAVSTSVRHTTENGVEKVTVTTTKQDGTTSTSTTSVIDQGDYLYLTKDYGTESQQHNTPHLKISKQGLLEADNAVIYGTIYATNGSFSGDIIANSFTLKTGTSIELGTNSGNNHYFGLASDGTLTVRNINAVNGEFTGTVNATGGTFTGTENVNGVMKVNGELNVVGESYIRGTQFITGLIYTQGANLIDVWTAFGCPNGRRMWTFEPNNISWFYDTFITSLAINMEKGQGLGSDPSISVQGMIRFSSFEGNLMKLKLIWENGHLLRDKAILSCQVGMIIYDIIFNKLTSPTEITVYKILPSSSGTYDMNTTSTLIGTMSGYKFTISY